MKAVLPRLLAEQKAEALALCKGDRLIAITIYVLGEQSYCLWNGGFLPEAANLQAGKLLIYAGIQRACELGLQEFDFLAGKEAYKYRWSTDIRYLGTRRLAADFSR